MTCKDSIVPIFSILILIASTLGLSNASDELFITESGKPVKIDGRWTSETEWVDATEMKIKDKDFIAYLRAKHNEVFVYILIDFISDQGLDSSSDLAVVCFDTKSNGGNVPHEDDYCFYRVTRSGDFTNGIIQGNGIGWTVLQESKLLDPDDTKLDVAVGYSNVNDPYDSINKHVIYEFRIPIDSYGFSEVMRFYVYVNDAYNNEFIEWPPNAGGKQFKLIIKDVLPAPNEWGNLHFKVDEGERPKSPIDVTTDKTDYYAGEIVNVEGRVPQLQNGRDINIIVKDANGETFTKLKSKPSDNSTFAASFKLPYHDKLFPTGKWTISVSYALWVTKVDINVLVSEKLALNSVSISEPEISTSTANELRVGDEATIISELKNEQKKEQHIFYILHIKDDTGATVMLDWQSRVLIADESTQFSTTWVPELEGKYIVRIFVWDDVVTPMPLSPTVSAEITVS